MLGLRSALFALVALAAAAPAAGQPARSGQDDYVRYCALCHGLEGTGLGPLADAMKKAPTNLTLLARRHGGKFPFDHIKQVITNGGAIKGHGSSAMLAWGPFFSEERDAGSPDDRIEQLIRFIEALQEK